MKRNDGETSGKRRDFLKIAGGAAVAFAAGKDTFAQSASSKSAPQKDRVRSAPPDRGMWITWYDLPMEGTRRLFLLAARDVSPRPVEAARLFVGGALRVAG